LVAPDLLGVKSFVPLIESHNEVVRRALRMKKTCNQVCDILTGRHVHPISAVIGGFTKLPTHENIETMLELLNKIKDDLDLTKELFKNLEFPDFNRETEYVALVNDSKTYPLLSGKVGSTDGVLKDKHDYKKITNEFVVPHSTAKHTRLSRESYAVGSLARINLNRKKLHQSAQTIAQEFNFNKKITNPYLNTVAQLIECYHCIEDSVNILNNFLKNGIDHSEEIIVGINEKSNIKIKSGEGVGAVEVPRGTLFHDYEIDEKGIILNANCVIPTNQNINNIEHDMKALVPQILDKKEEQIKLHLEMLVRSYDPCISCSAHFLDIKFVK
jgi:coenzyme F420-reducing hydrogenase alpha subunit